MFLYNIYSATQATNYPHSYFVILFISIKQATNYHGHHTRTRKAKDAWIDIQVAFAESAALSRKRRESQRKECLGYKVETKGKSELER